MTSSTVTVAWNHPPPNISDHINYYLIEAIHETDRHKSVVPLPRNQLYLFENLKPATTYKFKIKTCNEYSKICGDWSNETEAATLDGGL